MREDIIEQTPPMTQLTQKVSDEGGFEIGYIFFAIVFWYLFLKD